MSEWCPLGFLQWLSRPPRCIPIKLDLEFRDCKPSSPFVVSSCLFSVWPKNWKTNDKLQNLYEWRLRYTLSFLTIAISIAVFSAHLRSGSRPSTVKASGWSGWWLNHEIQWERLIFEDRSLFVSHPQSLRMFYLYAVTMCYITYIYIFINTYVYTYIYIYVYICI